jgi:RimJ/RimL family protein N-acetyltransferase
LLRRVAVARPDKGFGSRFLAGVIDWTFRTTAAHRLWLNVVDDNDRASHVYHVLGFMEEGRKREAFLKPDGRRRDMLMMSMLRREWQDGALQRMRSTLPTTNR